MSLLCKFNVGKRLNLIGRAGFERRCIVAGLHYNEDSNWVLNSYKKLLERSPSKLLKNHVSKCQGQLELRRNRYKSGGSNARRKLNFVGANKTNPDYGSKALQPEPSDKIVQLEKDRILEHL